MNRPIVIAGSYLVFGFAWIYLSDLIVFQLSDNEATIHRLQNYKGFAFVLVSTALIFTLTYVLYRRVFIHQRSLQQKILDVKEQNLLIRENQERLLQAEQIGKLGSWEFDPNVKYMICSPMITNILELNLKEKPITIDDFTSLIQDDDRKFFSKKINDAIEKKDGFDIETSIHTTNNSNKNVRIIGRPIEFGNGQFKLIGTIQDITDRVQILEKMAVYTLESIEKERTYISSEIHDSLTQKLSLISMQLKNLSKGNEQLLEDKRYEQSLEYLNMAIDESRSIAYKIMPQSIKKFGLVASIEEFIEFLENDSLPQITFNYNTEFRLDAQIELQLFRIVQESIQNILKHAEASTIKVSLHYNDHLHLQITDDGKGFKYEDKLRQNDCLGLKTMEYRAQQINAKFKIDSEINKGTTVNVILNYDK